jgi:hypothetical protein
VTALDAYAADCRLFGQIDLGDGRLTELLNGASEVRIVDARLKSLSDAHVVQSAELTVGRDELYAVVADGPRGDIARRLRTRAIKVIVDLGPYQVAGSIHGTPASNPLAGVLRRAPWVPLTDAVITYRQGSDSVSDEVATLLINRGQASSIRPAEEETPILPWEGSGTPWPAAPGALDLTNALKDEDPRDRV